MLRIERPLSYPATPLQRVPSANVSAFAEVAYQDERFQGRAAPSRVVAAGHPPAPRQVLHLQHTMGNLAVGRILAAQRIGVPESGTAARGRSMLGPAASLVLQRSKFDVLFHIRAPNSNENENWRIVDALASGDPPKPRVETMAKVNERQEAYTRRRVRSKAHLRHVIPWDQIMTDVAELSGTLRNAADHINRNWPEESYRKNPGLPNPIDRRAVERYARKWALARSDSPSNLFWGDAAENRVRGSQYDAPTKAKAHRNDVEGSAFGWRARRKVVEEQLENLGIDGEGGLNAQQGLNLSNWLLTETELTPVERAGLTTLSVNEIVKKLSDLNTFSKLTLSGVYNRRPTGQHPYGY